MFNVVWYNKTMKIALLIHGYNGIPEIFKYFRNELEVIGYKVIMPSLPTRQEISFSNWESELNKMSLPTEIPLLIAHSIGNEFMVRYCAKHGLNIRLYVGLAGFVKSFTHDGRNDLNEVVAKMQCTAQEIDKFRELAVLRYALYSDDDHIVPYDILQNFPEEISAKSIIIPGIGHMGKKSGLAELPEVIKIVKDNGPNVTA